MTEVVERTRRKSPKNTVHFDLEGKWLADLARTRLEEGCWERALTLLMESLEGITHEQSQQILTGRADLSGWASDKDGLSFDGLPEGNPLAVRMDAAQNRLYGEVFRFKDEYWQPYAVVQGYCRDDLEHAERWGRSYKSSGFGFGDSKYSVLRPLYYADQPDSDLVVYVGHPSAKHGTVVLCSRSKMPPTWRKVPSDRPEDFLEKLIKAGKTWSRRGADRSGQGYNEDAEAEALPPMSAGRNPRAAPEPKLPVPNAGDASEMAAEFLKRLDQTKTSADISALEREFDDRFSAMRGRADSFSVDETLQGAEEAAYQRLLVAYRADIAAQADKLGGWLELRVTQDDGTPYVGPGELLRIPKNPFLLWCLKGFDFETQGKVRPAWQNVCPMGMKMMVDDTNHTDWMVGAGLNPDDTYKLDDSSYERRVQLCAFRLRAELVEEWTSAKFVTLARGLEDRFYGEVVHARPNCGVEPGSIAIVPHAGPEYQLTLETASKRGSSGRPGLVICETGGKLAHLAVVGREMQHTLLMVPDARKRYPKGTSMSINLLDGTLTWYL